MQSLTGKVTGGTLTAAEWNQLPQEVQNMITTMLSAGLTAGDLNQLGKAMATAASAGTWYSDSGSADTYVCSIVTGQAPDRYFNGMEVRFEPSAACTGGVVTINVNGLGAKNIITSSGSPPTAGDISPSYDTLVRYSTDSGGKFYLADSARILSDGSAPQGYLSGFTIANDGTDAANDILFGSGSCRDAANTTTMVRSSGYIKKSDASWSAGNNAGGWPSAVTRTNDTWYHCFVISNADGATDFGWDSSLTATNLLAAATGFIKYRRIGSTKFGTGAWDQFQQHGDEFWLDTSVQDVNSTNPGTGVVTHTLGEIPTGLSFQAIASISVDYDANAFYLVGSGFSTLGTPSATNYTMETRSTATAKTASVMSRILTNTTAQIKTKQDASGAGANLVIQVYGWVDNRGKDA